MKKISFGLKKTLTTKSSERYNFSESDRSRYISEITEIVRKDVRMNEIKEAESIEYASKFVTI